MDLPQAQHTLLSQPTRARIFELLEQAKRPMSTDELAAALKLHPNGVRAHLGRLHRAGLIERRRRRLPRGRPHDEWAISAKALPQGQRPRGYQELSRWLAAAIPPGRNRLREVESAGRRIGRELAPAEGGSTEPVLETVLSALGFQPKLDRRKDRLTCTLGNCPYRDAVKENQEVVCTLHRGMTRGLLDVVEPEARLSGFVPRDPDQAGCLIEVDRLPARAQ